MARNQAAVSQWPVHGCIGTVTNRASQNGPAMVRGIDELWEVWSAGMYFAKWKDSYLHWIGKYLNWGC